MHVHNPVLPFEDDTPQLRSEVELTMMQRSVSGLIGHDQVLASETEQS